MKAKRAPPSDFNGMPFSSLAMQLDYGDVDCSRTFLALLDVKRYLVAFIERLESARINTRVMHKYIRTIFLLDETIAFTTIKPFYNTIRHNNTLL